MSTTARSSDDAVFDERDSLGLCRRRSSVPDLADTFKSGDSIMGDLGVNGRGDSGRNESTGLKEGLIGR